MDIVVFEDELVPRLYPIALARPAYAISCGSYCLADWLEQLGPWRGIVRPYLRDLQQARFPLPHGSSVPSRKTLLVNARVVPGAANHRVLQRLAGGPRPAAIWCGEHLAAALIDRSVGDVGGPLAASDLKNYAGAVEPADATLTLLDFPHDVVRYNLATLSENLEHRLQSGAYQEVAEGVFAAQGARLGQFIVSDIRRGPILLDQNATVGPYCFLSGPVYLGRGARVIEHSAIKDSVSIGHTTKIGGEVEASVIEPYTNKQHHGFLGHSYLGSWINLGAGTCNSDLKNTYGTVNMDYRCGRVQTGMQFMGCIVGDYSKTAINTSIFTGKVVGVCSMVYGFVTTNVPSFVNYARSFGQVTELPAEVMIATQQRMFARRDVRQEPLDAQLIRDLYELTRDERQLAGEPLSL